MSGPTERDVALGGELLLALERAGLHLSMLGYGLPLTQDELGRAYQIVEAQVLEAEAERLLELLAGQYPEIASCELLSDKHGGWMIDVTAAGWGGTTPAATGETPLDAVRALERELVAAEHRRALSEALNSGDGSWRP